MQQNDNFRLVIRRGPQPNQSFDILKDVTSLGRDISNDIVINDRETSRHHLRLTRSGDTMTIEDLGSTNGTFVNGKRISGLTPLQNGDMIGLGETVTLALESLAQSETPPPSPPVTPEPAPPPEPTYAPPAEYAAPSTPPPGEPYPQQPAYPAYPEQAEPQQQAYAGAPAPYAPPPAPPQQYAGYDYDPYAAREESSSTSPWLILGCFVFFVLVFVCFAGIALTVIDVLNLWCELPVVRDVILALGFGC